MSEQKVVVERVRQWGGGGGVWETDDGNHDTRPRALLIHVSGVEVPEWVPEIGETVHKEHFGERRVASTPYWNGPIARWCVQTDYGECYLDRIRPIQKPEKVTGTKVGRLKIVGDVGNVDFSADFHSDRPKPGTYAIVRVDEGGEG